MPLRVGIIGTGWGCNVQAPLFRDAGLEVTAIYSRDRAKAEKKCASLRVPHAFDSVEALCGSPEVDVVSVVSPTFLHAEHALAALRAGKHLLSDKPTAVTARQAAAIAEEAAKRPGQIAIIDHELRFLKFVQAARELVTSGAIGAVRHVTSQFMVNMGGLGRNFSWWHDRSMGGGVSGALGVHVIDLCAFVTGSRISTVAGQASTFVREKPVRGSSESRAATADDFFTISGRMDNGAAVSIVVSGVSQAKPNRNVTVVGDKGSVVVDMERVTTTHFDAAGKAAATVTEKDMRAPDAFMQGTFALAQALAASGGDPSAAALAPACRIADGVYVQSVIDAMLASSDSGATAKVALPPTSRL
mmetsp:Transcript_81531/g.231030  ORF Transcript_81531/g.231030 Transcript_81531/m.231030 type:complete len:359 (-) Transcript_81531:175-1251(-)